MDPGLINPAEVFQKVCALRFIGKNLTNAVWIHSAEPARCFNSENNAPPTAQATTSELAWMISAEFSCPQQMSQHSVNLRFNKQRFEASHIPELTDDYFKFLRTLKPKTHFNFMSNFMGQSLGL